MEKTTAISVYEQYLLGNGKLIIPAFSREKAAAAKEREKNAYDILRYAITELMGWTPDEALECLTPAVAKTLRLDQVIEKYIEIPKDVLKNVNYDYFVYMAFPNETSYNPYVNLIRMYKRVLTGELPKFPRKYFNGPNGHVKAAHLLMYIISRNLPVDEENIKDLYVLFATPSKINKKLKAWKIYDVCKTMYSSPLEYLHTSLPEDMADSFLFNWLVFKESMEYYKKEQKKKASA